MLVGVVSSVELVVSCLAQMPRNRELMMQVGCGERWDECQDEYRQPVLATGKQAYTKIIPGRLGASSFMQAYFTLGFVENVRLVFRLRVFPPVPPAARGWLWASGSPAIDAYTQQLSRGRRN